MSVKGQKRTKTPSPMMSAFGGKADEIGGKAYISLLCPEFRYQCYAGTMSTGSLSPATYPKKERSERTEIDATGSCNRQSSFTGGVCRRYGLSGTQRRENSYATTTTNALPSSGKSAEFFRFQAVRTLTFGPASAGSFFC